MSRDYDEAHDPVKFQVVRGVRSQMQDGCTESNCRRCLTHPDHRGDMPHAGIGSTGKQQVVEVPVTDAGRTVAYNAIDRFLRNNMDDPTYAAYVEHLEALSAAVPAQGIDLGPVREFMADCAANSNDVHIPTVRSERAAKLLALIDQRGAAPGGNA